MSTDALLLVLAGAALHALWNLLAKQASGGGIPFIWLYGLVSLTCAAPFGVYVWSQAPHALSGAMCAAAIGSAIVHVLYCIMLQKGYQQADFSVVYPVARGTGPLFSVMGAVALLDEWPGALGWAGIAAVLLGVLLLAGVHQLGGTRDSRLRSGIVWGALTGLSIAAYTLIDGWAVKTLAISPPVYYVIGLGLRTILLAPAALRCPASLRDQWQMHRTYIIAVGVLSPLAYILVLLAMVRAPLSLVAPVRELSMFLGVLFGAHLLREQNMRSRAIGAALMIAGVAMLART